ncbi:MAG: putative metal-binding motif-containing protein [Myxococcota bacterium]
MWAFLLACSTPEPLDLDRDGVLSDVDCDDRDAFVNPGAIEVCDGRDNDCDGAIDDADPDVTPFAWYADEDGDGFASDVDAEPVRACEPPEGTWSRQRGDCAPLDPLVNPSVPDGCDRVDTDCDGVIDDEPEVPRFIDRDGDGFGALEVLTCDPEGSAEVGGDCDDLDPTVFPGAPERCNELDDDCDALVDDSDEDVAAPEWFVDEDRDGFGVAGPVTLEACVPPNAFWALAPGDCDDLDPTVYPGALEVCDGRDSDCDGRLPTDDAWADPDRELRLRTVVTASVPTGPDAVAFVDVDFRAALDAVGESGPFDPDTLTAWIQDCEAGAREVGVSFTDGFARVLEPVDPTDSLGDAHGAVHLRFTEPLATTPLPVDLYFGGAPANAPTPVVTATSIETGRLSMTVDPDRGGLLDDLRVQNTNVLSQADAFEGNGVREAGDWVRLAVPGALPTVLADSGGIGLITLHDTGGPFRSETWWWTYPDVPAVFARIAIAAAEARVADAEADVRPVQTVAPGLPNAIPNQGPGWAGFRDGVGVQWGFVTETEGGLGFTCEATTCFASGSEDGGTVLPAGTPWIDHRVWFAVVDDGTGTGDTARIAGYLSPPAVALGDVGRRPAR